MGGRLGHDIYQGPLEGSTGFNLQRNSLKVKRVSCSPSPLLPLCSFEYFAQSQIEAHLYLSFVRLFKPRCLG